ncbi:MAG: hypothetical protein ACRD3E_00615 [Terriglobales bacterium]
MRGARKAIFCVLLCVSASPVVNAQTIRPVLSEYRGEAAGTFELVNNSFLPVNVVLEPRSFNVSETGEITYGPLDPAVHVKFASRSFQIAPKQSYVAAYRAKADKLPAWFVVYATMSGFPQRTSTGLAIAVQLPHTVYILPKKDATKQEVHVAKAVFDAQTKIVSVELESSSQNFTRVNETEIIAGKKKISGPGFPLYPGKSRKLDVAWKEDGVPDRVVFHVRGFNIEAPISNQ